MKNKYSIFSLIKNAFSYHENWQKAWNDPQPKKEYDAVIVGGGGHGLATAYYLAKKHNMKNIAVVEKGWIGGGNTGRNTTHRNRVAKPVWAKYVHSSRELQPLG